MEPESVLNVPPKVHLAVPKVSGGARVYSKKTKIWYSSGSSPFSDLPEPHQTFSWPSPDLDLDLSLTIYSFVYCYNVPVSRLLIFNFCIIGVMAIAMALDLAMALTMTLAMAMVTDHLTLDTIVEYCKILLSALVTRSKCKMINRCDQKLHN